MGKENSGVNLEGQCGPTKHRPNVLFRITNGQATDPLRPAESIF